MMADEPGKPKKRNPFFIEDLTTGRVRVTAEGKKIFGSQFARAGINIDEIRTREEVRWAHEVSMPYFVDDLVKVLEIIVKMDPTMREKVEEIKRIFGR